MRHPSRSLSAALPAAVLLALGPAPAHAATAASGHPTREAAFPAPGSGRAQVERCLDTTTGFG